jgi:hypothetical protein
MLHEHFIPLDIPIIKLRNYIKETYNSNKYIHELKFKGLDIFSSYKITPHTISLRDTFLPLYKLYNILTTEITPKIEHDRGQIEFEQARFCIELQKTLVMSENIKDPCCLPPELGRLALYNSNSNMATIPIHQNEALIMVLSKTDFSRAHKPVATKVYYNGFNIITGIHKKYDHGLTQNPQNYLIDPGQGWIDGYVIRNNKQPGLYYGSTIDVKQFTAPKINPNISIGDNMNEFTGDELEFEVFSPYKKFKCYNVTKGEFMNDSHYGNLNDKLIFFEKVNSALECLTYTLGDCGITKNDTLEIIKIPRIGSIFVKTLSGKTYTVPFELNMSVDKLKKYIQLEYGIPPVDQRIIYGGKQFDDSKLLNDYGIKEDTFVQLVLRLPSGYCRSNYYKDVLQGGIIKQQLFDDKEYKNWNTLVYGKYKINIVNGVQFSGTMPYATITDETYVEHKYPICKNVRDIDNIKRRMCLIKYVTFKTSIVHHPIFNVFSQDHFDIILEKMLDVYQIKECI